MNGKQGDHPLTDILLHHLPIFSPKADEMIIEIDKLGGRRELDERFNHYLKLYNCGIEFLEAELEEMRNRLKREAQDRGWEVE